MIRRFFISLSPLASDMKPGAASEVTRMGPGCLTGVVSDISPDSGLLLSQI